MSQIYSDRKRTAATAPQKENVTPQPAMDALRSGAVQPTQEQMGHRVDLPDAMRAKMENAFGADLGAVKLYESQAVADTGAKAITQGSNIAFAPGMLDFSSYGGQALLGHELSHVVSQARGEVTGGGFLNDSMLEARADREGAMAAAGESVAVPTAAMSPVSASAAAGPMQAKGKDKSKKKGDAQVDPQEQAKQWHSMLSPAAQRYIQPEDLYHAPTASREEMDRQVQQREQYNDIRGVKSDKFTAALRQRYNDPNATSDTSAAGDMGRRMEALFDPSDSPEADAYNQDMFEAFEAVRDTEGATGTVSMNEDLISKMGRTFAPFVSQVMSAGGTPEGYKQFAQEHFGESKFMIGKLHALPDSLKKVDAASKDAVIRAAGYEGSYDDFTRMAQPMNNAFSQGWVESGKAMGVGANLLFRGIESATANGERKAGESAVRAPFTPGEKTSDQSFDYRTAQLPTGNFNASELSKDQQLRILYERIKNPSPDDDPDTISYNKRLFAHLRSGRDGYVK